MSCVASRPARIASAMAIAATGITGAERHDERRRLHAAGELRRPSRSVAAQVAT